MLSSLFPSSSSTQSFKTTFNPTSESVNFDQKIKKKGSSHVRAFKLWVVVGEKLFTAIPKATLRKTLNKSGRVKKVEFRRTMSSLQVKNQITKAFPSLKLDNPVFMKCVDLKMVTVDMESVPAKKPQQQEETDPAMRYLDGGDVGERTYVPQ